MPENHLFLPEGLRPPAHHTIESLRLAAENGAILEAPVRRCDSNHRLHLSLNGIAGIIDRSKVVASWISGAEREISVLSRVGKYSCFTVESVSSDEKGAPLAILSRQKAQEKAMDFFLEHLKPGMVLSCRITRLESFGVFADIGCGIIAMLPIEHISVARIRHPGERFREGQRFLAAVLSFDRERRRIVLTHRELLGTWLENASRFSPGETVRGTVRSVKEYGAFVELSPNLSGLADSKEPLTEGDQVSVFIKSIRPERMKIKLQVIEKLLPLDTPEPLQYQITDGCLEHWRYSPPNYERAPIETDFTASAP
ncbi:MAG: 30S ribosomal protein S1 [Ruminococcaceae bacterium]|nr:30S ribosomal protein S1 [Oscillospiraceae bacterium]